MHLMHLMQHYSASWALPGKCIASNAPLRWAALGENTKLAYPENLMPQVQVTSLQGHDSKKLQQFDTMDQMQLRTDEGCSPSAAAVARRTLGEDCSKVQIIGSTHHNSVSILSLLFIFRGPTSSPRHFPA
jgi:hypothetical protein